MATAAQIQGESWWQREIVTTELDWIGDEICRRTGQPRDAAGTKGNTAHDSGAHRSQEWLLNSIYCTNRTYTVQPGLTATQARHIAGFDFTPGNVNAMIAQSRRLIAAMRAGLLDEVLAVYCNVDGDQVVDGWDNVRDRAATSDSSHLWHWHLTLDRRHMTNRALMERIVAIVLGDPITEEDDDMIGFAKDDSGKLRKSIGGITWPCTEAEMNDIRSLSAQGILGPASAKVHPNDAAGTAFGYPIERLVDDIAKKVGATPAVPTVVTDEQLERVLRKVLGSLDGATPVP